MSAFAYIFQDFPYFEFIDQNGHTDYTKYRITPPQKSDYWLPLLVSAWDAGIVIVIGGGNRPERTLGDVTPQRYGRVDNALITVASLDASGLFSKINTRIAAARDGVDPELTGAYTVNAQGGQVKVAVAHEQTYYRYTDGASFASPQVAGLAAYFMGLPNNGLPANPVLAVKQKLVALRRDLHNVDGYAAAYNGVRELACSSTNTRKSRREARRLSTRKNEKVVVVRQNGGQGNGPETVFANGQLLSPKYANLVSPFFFEQLLCFLFPHD